MGAARADGGSNCRGEECLWGENERAWGLATGREWFSHERRRVAHPDGKGKARRERTMRSEEERRLEGGTSECERSETRPARLSSSPSRPVQGPPPRPISMLSLPSRLALRSLLHPPSNVVAHTRHFAGATVPARRDTDSVNHAQAESNNSMDQITDILDDADLSTSPRSNNFSGKLIVVSASQPPN